MTKRKDSVLDLSVDLYLAYAGMETDLIFTQGIDLPGFASYPLLETPQGRTLLKGYLSDMITLAREKRMGVILESPTWVANRNRAAALGYAPETLAEINKQAIDLLDSLRSRHTGLPIVISANIGPRDDAYAPRAQMTPQDAEHYHSEQIATFAQTAADVVSGYTLAYPAEAIGIVRAARRFELPVVVAFTVETDGKLPTGETLEQAITEVDTASDSYASYFMINCAHPDHFVTSLDNRPWMKRIKGIVANASRCSHAELDQAKELDAGDPRELGKALSDIHKRFPHLQVLGGCCGTDMRHMTEIADALAVHSS